MKWRKRVPPPARADEETTMQASIETVRAQDAARDASRQLAEIRAQRPRTERIAGEIEQVNERNGFYLLVRDALRSG